MASAPSQTLRPPPNPFGPFEPFGPFQLCPHASVGVSGPPIPLGHHSSISSPGKLHRAVQTQLLPRAASSREDGLSMTAETAPRPVVVSPSLPPSAFLCLPLRCLPRQRDRPCSQEMLCGLPPSTADSLRRSPVGLQQLLALSALGGRERWEGTIWVITSNVSLVWSGWLHKYGTCLAEICLELPCMIKRH